MSTLSSVPEESIKEAVLDGLSNHTKEFANPWIFKKNYSHDELADILRDIMASERIFKNLNALINQQIKFVFDELEGEAEAFERTSKKRDGLTHFAVPLSTIQKIRSRYESSHSM